MNIRDIARLANVTPGTVSKVLNNYPDISEATRQHVLQIIAESKYAPNNSARSLKLATKIPTIALISEGVNNNLTEDMMEMLSIRFHNADHTILSFHDNYFVQDKKEKFEELLSYATRHGLTGMIYFGGDFKDIPAQMFSSLPCPVIFVNTRLPGGPLTDVCSSVQTDHYETARHQMEYLIARGHQNICMLITSVIDTSVYHLRWEAGRDVLKSHGLNDSLVAESDYRCGRGYRELTALLEKHPEITAIYCTADVMAAAAIRAIHDVGKIPGKDISIISFDGMEALQYYTPSITTYAQPTEEMMNYTYDLLMGLMNGTRQHQHITFQAKLSEQESVADIREHIS
ncbi:MAG: LacI family transcriptional regulator [Lachnospiraceae bacterium]|nr:LacI family transcriptional regulator [Lachnospiraceae bacterium]